MKKYNLITDNMIIIIVMFFEIKFSWRKIKNAYEFLF